MFGFMAMDRLTLAKVILDARRGQKRTTVLEMARQIGKNI